MTRFFMWNVVAAVLSMSAPVEQQATPTPTVYERIIETVGATLEDGSRKELLARYNDILIDDYGRNVLRWRKAGGCAILCPQPWNDAASLAANSFEAVCQGLWALTRAEQEARA